VIRIDAVWLAIEPIDMRAGGDRLLVRVVQVLGGATAHHGYLFCNARASGSSCWCTTASMCSAARRLNVGSFEWPRCATDGTSVTLTPEQFDALVLGLPWLRLEQLHVITRM